MNSGWFLLYCSCPTVRDCPAVYPALFECESTLSFCRSELILILIPTWCLGVCDKDYYCNWVVSEYEEEIENWYYHKQQIFTDFTNFLCVEKAQLCCPDDHYGEKCKSCASLKCGLHGKCQVRTMKSAVLWRNAHTSVDASSLTNFIMK